MFYWHKLDLNPLSTPLLIWFTTLAKAIFFRLVSLKWRDSQWDWHKLLDHFWTCFPGPTLDWLKDYRLCCFSKLCILYADASHSVQFPVHLNGYLRYKCFLLLSHPQKPVSYTVFYISVLHLSHWEYALSHSHIPILTSGEMLVTNKVNQKMLLCWRSFQASVNWYFLSKNS